MDALRRAFRDITAGHTRAVILDRPAYLRHLSYADQIGFDEKRAEYLELARQQGIPTDEEKLVELRRAGKWSDTRENELKRAKSYILELEDGKRKNAKMPSLVEGFVQRIKEATLDWQKKEAEKRQLLGLTCEVSADVEVNEFYIVANLYRDAAMTEPCFPPAEFDHFRDDKVARIVEAYNAALECCNEQNIKRLAMQGFFQRYFQLCGDDITKLFGKPIAHLTFYQRDLLHWGAHFRHIYQNHDVQNWKREVMEDPDLLTDYASAVTKGKEDLQKQGAYDKDAVVVGAKSEDAKALGLKQANPLREMQERFGGNVMEWAQAKGR